MNTTKAKAYAAQDATSALTPFDITRREPGPLDVEIEILYCGVCHSDVHTSPNKIADRSLGVEVTQGGESVALARLAHSK